PGVSTSSMTGTAVDHAPACSGSPPRRSAWGPYRDRSVANAADRESDIAPHWKRPPPTGTESRSAEAGRQCSEQMFDAQAPQNIAMRVLIIKVLIGIALGIAIILVFVLFGHSSTPV